MYTFDSLWDLSLNNHGVSNKSRLFKANFGRETTLNQSHIIVYYSLFHKHYTIYFVLWGHLQVSDGEKLNYY